MHNLHGSLTLSQRSLVRACIVLMALWLCAMRNAAAQEHGYVVLSADSLVDDHVGTPHFEYGRGHFGRCTALLGTWRYHAGDDLRWADPQYDDSDWAAARTWIDFHAQEQKVLPPGMPGIGWFRLHLRADSSLAQMPLGLAVYRGSATEVYLDGRLVHETGQVGRTPSEEVPRWSYASSPISLRPDTTHVLAVRYSNFSARSVLEAGEDAGFYVVLGERPTMQQRQVRLTREVSIHQMLLTGILMALAFLHLVLFVFYPAARAHLYFAVVAASIGAAVFLDLQIHFVSSTEANVLRFRLLQVTGLVATLALLRFAHAIVHERTPRYLYVLAAIGIALGIGLWFTHLRPYVMTLYVVLLIDAVRVLGRGVIWRGAGAWIIGLGLLPLLLVLILYASMIVGVVDPWWDIYVVPLYGYAMLFLALSMSIYLARDFAGTKRGLARAKERLEDYSHTLEEKVETRTRDLQTEKEKTEEQARRLREVDEAKSRFFTDVSHEFRTPLTLILGPLREALAERRVRFSRSQLEAMHRNARRLLGLVNQLLDLARLETGSMRLNRQPVDLAGLLKDVTTAFAGRAERERVTLSFHSAVNQLRVLADPDKLEKVVFNLLSNAFKFTPSGGKVRVHLRVEDKREGPHAEITVKDTGQGIPPEKLPHVFDRFFQVTEAATREQAGTGIGLALAKELVELHGGRIEVESDSGFGTSFVVRLPIEKDDLSSMDVAREPEAVKLDGAGSAAAVGTDSEAELEETASHQVSRAEAPAETASLVLIAEDNADLRTYVRELLAADYRVVEAEDGEEGLRMARQHQPDLVIADVMMPHLGGFDLCRALKEDAEFSHVPVVLLTAKADQESRLEGLGTGADAYLSKPFVAEELLLHVENLIELRRQLRDRYSETVIVGPSQVEVTPRDAAFLERVREVVEEHLGDSTFGVERLAEEVNLSARQLQRRLRGSADLSAAAFIRKMRLERAAQLLAQDAGTVSEIAYRVGYGNADAFSRVFRQVYGVPPSDYPD